MPQTVLHPLAPLITAESHTLILGTMPSPRSRAETFYYAHPQNRFWPVIAALYGEEDPKTSEGRAELLLSHGLALWDVLASCTITGAADSTMAVKSAARWAVVMANVMSETGARPRARTTGRHRRRRHENAWLHPVR